MEQVMKDRLLSIFLLFFIGLSSIAFFCIASIIWAITALFDRKLTILHYYSSLWAACYLKIVPAWNVQVVGRQKIDSNKCYIIVSNHLSQLDILACYKLFKPFKWVSKAEVFKIPFIGWNMVLNRYISIKRGDRAGIKHMLLNCEKTLNKGSSIFIFPEGTRSVDGNIGKFANGAFALATKLNLPIIPVVIKGAHQALPKNSLVIRSQHKITIEVLDPVEPESFTGKKPSELASEVRGLIADKYYDSNTGEPQGEKEAA